MANKELENNQYLPIWLFFASLRLLQDRCLAALVDCFQAPEKILFLRERQNYQTHVVFVFDQ